MKRMNSELTIGIILLVIFFTLVVTDRLLETFGFESLLYYLGYIIGLIVGFVKNIF